LSILYANVSQSAYPTLSIRRSVGWLVNRSVGWPASQPEKDSTKPTVSVSGQTEILLGLIIIHKYYQGTMKVLWGIIF